MDDYDGLGRRYAAVWRSEEWCGVKLGDPQVSLWGANFDVKPYDHMVGKLKLLLQNRLLIGTWSLNEQKTQDILGKVKGFHPKLIVAYASSIHRIAKFINYNPYPIPSLKAIITSAETLTDDMRKGIETTFQVPVYNRYASRDVHHVAQECSAHEGLHITAENCFVEIVKDGKQVPPGEMGEIVVTRLDNWALPFIRYRTGDLGIMSERVCSCGRGLPLLGKVEGRVQDMI